MRSHASSRREFTLPLVVSLALAVALFLLLTIHPASFPSETGVSGSAHMGGALPREDQAFILRQGGQNSMINRGRDIIQETILDTVGPLLHIFQIPISAYRSVYERVRGWQYLEQENRKLKSKLNRLRSLSVRMDELALENQRLRLLLNMNAEPAYRELVARIIGGSSSAFAHSLLLNAGRDEGVVYEATAMASGGLFGRVVRVARHTSLILSLLDLNSRVPVLVQRSRVRAIVSGRNKPLLNLEFVPKGADVRVGDLVITSGIGEIFPKGLLVGRVHAIAATEETGLFHMISVQPVVDFDRTEEVRLLLPMDHTFKQEEQAKTDQKTDPKTAANTGMVASGL